VPDSTTTASPTPRRSPRIVCVRRLGFHMELGCTGEQTRLAVSQRLRGRRISCYGGREVAGLDLFEARGVEAAGFLLYTPQRAYRQAMQPNVSSQVTPLEAWFGLAVIWLVITLVFGPV
jgi:hypothetical protein